jgi:hypothetical protein
MPVDENSRNNLLDNPMPDAIRVSLIVTRILEEHGVPYLIGGSVASIIHGEPRLTNDIDLVADLREEQVSQLVAALETDFYVDDRAMRRAIRRRWAAKLAISDLLEKAFDDAGIDPSAPQASDTESD